MVKKISYYNKARYTANTSCGRVGRGGIAHFHTFQLMFTDQRTDGRTNKGLFRVACPQLKKKKREEERNMESKIERKKERVNKNKE